MLREAVVVGLCLLPLALSRILGPESYARHRLPVALLLRLAFCAFPVAMGANLVPALPDKQDGWHALGRLFLVARGFTLLVPPLCFLVPPRLFMALQTVCAAGAMVCVRWDCGCCYLQLPHVRRELERASRWLGTCATLAPIPLPPVELPQRYDACLLLARWLQFCWLLVLPCALALCGAMAARREFVLRLPRGAMPQQERSWWAALAVPPLWQILLLFMPAFSLSVYRIAAQVPPLVHDTGVAALSCCLWITQLLSVVHGRQSRAFSKPAVLQASLLLALNFLPLFEGQNWQICRSRPRCLTILKLGMFALLAWDTGNSVGGLHRWSSGLPADDGMLSTPGAPSMSSPPSMPLATCSVSEPAAFRLWVGKQSSADCPGEQLAHKEPSPASMSNGSVIGGSGSGGSGSVVEEPATASCCGGRSLPLVALVAESKLFALLHAGLAFRYPRWQQTAALQSILTVLAGAQTHFHDICTHSELASPAGRWTVDKLAALLTNCNWLPLAPGPPVLGALGGGAGVGQLQVPAGVDRCRLVLAWMQLCLGWALPIWAALLSECGARSQFAACNLQHLEASEKEWAVTAAVGYDWAAMACEW
ncbi:hypothetical protein C2E21_6053 [Chlorella sorokiniana]|uniref:Uncharacterized protein n=1 Tax=Chlorella sorokiniana TaxID=3076 RepID=A0A2P6TMH6_CHLSO|nr:hypothetical protein C2E21_6053 [Chlorella sorokiniana]|eukprot:PRW45549.1 hypothetical protein C2E21_6053 [Chlorella sorokiniana]